MPARLTPSEGPPAWATHRGAVASAVTPAPTLNPAPSSPLIVVVPRSPTRFPCSSREWGGCSISDVLLQLEQSLSAEMPDRMESVQAVEYPRPSLLQAFCLQARRLG